MGAGFLAIITLEDPLANTPPLSSTLGDKSVVSANAGAFSTANLGLLIYERKAKGTTLVK